MPIDITQLQTELVAYAPHGVELPRGGDNQVLTSVIERWAAEAAQQLNDRRGVTTILEDEVTLLEGTDEYDLPAGAREIIEIRRQTLGQQPSNLGVPCNRVHYGYSPFGYLPTGHEVSASLDLLHRQRMARVRREDDYEVYQGQIRFKFPIVAGEVILVRYRVVNRDIAELPDDLFDTVLLYLRFRNLDWYVEKHGSAVVLDSDRFSPVDINVLVRQRFALESEWISKLNSITPEVSPS